MTRTHNHSSGLGAAIHDRHQPRQNAGDARGAIKKTGGGAHNWGSVSAEAEELPLGRQLGDSNFQSVEDPAELERLVGDREAKQYEGRLQVVDADEFAKAKGVDIEAVKEAAREHAKA